MTDKIKDRLAWAILGAVLCFLVSYMAGGYHFRDTAKMVVRTDTLHDTVTVREPVFVTETAVRTDTVWLPVVRTRTDTVLLTSNGRKTACGQLFPSRKKSTRTARIGRG